jgi:hypothetical protein
LKKLMISALLAGQIGIAGQPAFAADLDGRSPFAEDQRGAFAGVRLRAQLGGSEPKLRAGLALTPTTHSRRGAASRMAFGEGLELGMMRTGKPVMTLAGKRLDRLSLLGEDVKGDRANMSTLAKVAIVAGVVIVVGTVAFAHVMSEASCFHGGDDGDC